MNPTTSTSIYKYGILDASVQALTDFYPPVYQARVEYVVDEELRRCSSEHRTQVEADWALSQTLKELKQKFGGWY